MNRKGVRITVRISKTVQVKPTRVITGRNTTNGEKEIWSFLSHEHVRRCSAGQVEPTRIEQLQAELEMVACALYAESEAAKQ